MILNKAMGKLVLHELGLSLLVFVLLVTHEAAVSASISANVSLPNCPDRCREVSVPYPFGIGKGCYKNEKYRIICNNTGAFLSSIQQEVTNITLGDDVNRGTFSVKSPVISSGCPGQDPMVLETVNVSDSPFFVSSLNKFTAVGCNNTAFLTNVSPMIAGCETTCEQTTGKDADKGKEVCNGYKCCQALIPPDLQVFGIRIQETSGTGCKAAFVSNKIFSPSDSTEPELLVAKKNVHMMLDWYLDEPNTNSTGTFICANAEIVVPNKNVSRCWCPEGLLYIGNPYLPGGCEEDDLGACTSERNPCGTRKCTSLGGGSIRCGDAETGYIILGIFLGLALLLLVGGIWLCCKCNGRRKRKKIKRNFFKRNGGLLLQQQLSSADGNVEKTKVFNSKELEIATDKFNENRILGQGGQGTVYKGMLADGSIVAVKKSKAVDEDKLEEFINEVVVLSQINHRHVVKLLGCCLETDVPMLVYEFIPNGNLFEHLHNESEEFPMTWDIRLRVMREIASALFYLHSGSNTPVYHRDIKTTNVLLDEKYRAKVSDFGTSRSVAIDQTHLTTLVYGTMGYVDPEYFQTSQFTEKSDVYSFGVMLVELLTGEKPLSVFRPQEGRVLATYFLQMMEENKLFDIIDPRIKEQCNLEDATAVANLARKCLGPSGRNRPTMREVSMELERIGVSPGDQKIGIQNEGNEGVVKINVAESWDADSSTAPMPDSGTTSSLDMDPLLSGRTY